MSRRYARTWDLTDNEWKISLQPGGTDALDSTNVYNTVAPDQDNDAILFHVAEKSDFRPYAFVKRLVAAGNDDVGRNAQSHKLLYGMLRRLGFLFV